MNHYEDIVNGTVNIESSMNHENHEERDFLLERSLKGLLQYGSIHMTHSQKKVTNTKTIRMDFLR